MTSVEIVPSHVLKEMKLRAARFAAVWERDTNYAENLSAKNAHESTKFG